VRGGAGSKEAAINSQKREKGRKGEVKILSSTKIKNNKIIKNKKETEPPGLNFGECIVGGLTI